MIHLGDITKINGVDVPPVDVVTGGSPCQDLSVAGLRKGMLHADKGDEETTRSGLFMEQIRIIKEMRDGFCKRLSMRGADVDRRLVKPRYMVWENVPGAFSSNGGEDFRAVLEETAKVAEGDACIPRFEGKWPPAGCIMGNGWSIAWRVHDAQFWGVPQRRKRISLVADFGGDTAPEILFERKGVSGDSEPSGTAREGTTGTVGSGVKVASWGIDHVITTGGNCTAQGPCVYEEVEATLKAAGPHAVFRSISFQERAGKPGGGKGILIQNERVGALSTLNNQSVCCLNDQGGNQMSVSDNVSGTLIAHGHQPIVYGISAYNSNVMKSSNPYSGIYQAETSRTLDLNGGSPACNQGGMAVICYDRFDERRNGPKEVGDISPTIIEACETSGNNTPIVIEGNGSRPSHKGDGYAESETMYTLNSTEHHAVFDARGNGEGKVSPTITGDHQNRITDYTAIVMETDEKNVPMVIEEPYNATTGSFMRAGNSGKAETLAARDYKDPQIGCQPVVRRLTPLECERLQGFPDGWTDIGEWIDSKGKKHKDADSPRYKALGNSIALPFWQWMANRMVRFLPEGSTMASLFDGIGGFPLVFSRAGCTPIWASEIEEFPIAVTKLRFPEGEEDG